MRSKLLLPILVLAVIRRSSVVYARHSPRRRNPFNLPATKCWRPSAHGNLTVFPVVATISHDTQDFLTLDEGSTLR